MSNVPALEKGRKLIHLYRRGVGGERVNAGRLLAAHLKTHDLTLFDLEPSLPVSQDVTVLDAWRESAGLMARLGTDAQDDVLTQLVDAPDLTSQEIEKLLTYLDLQKLAEVRVSGWAGLNGVSASDYLNASKFVRAVDLLNLKGSLAERFLAATMQAHFKLTHPERLIKSESVITRQFLLGVVESLTGQPGVAVEGGVRAHLNVEQLARLRALLAQHGAQAEHIALNAAQQFGRTLK